MMQMKLSGHKKLTFVALFVALLSSFLQFHSHDCCGHVRIENAAFQLFLGCNGESTDGCNHDIVQFYCGSDKSSHHEHSDDNEDDCAFHLSKVQLTSLRTDISVASHEIYNLLFTLWPQACDCAESTTLLEYIVLHFKSDRTAEFSVANSLRGSPLFF